MPIPIAHAQSGGEIENLKKEIETLKKNQREILKELEALKRTIPRIPPLRSGRRPPSNVVLRVKGNPFKGSGNARVTLIEFSDYQCPFCARHARETLPKLEKEYIHTGKLKYVFRDYPIPQLHPEAPKAHEAANCSGRQNQYWKFHDLLFQDQRSLAVSRLKKFARDLGLDMAKFNRCLDGGEETAEIAADRREGGMAGIRGTPTFFLAYTVPNEDDVKTVGRIMGAQPYDVFKSAIDSLLAIKK